MDSRTKSYRQVSPERAKVWKEKSPKYHQVIKRVPVVYYLCRNRQLEHPHFIEVPLSSPEGLYLRDVVNRLNVLRGRGMASMYSWSSKRSYRNGFVWHDLSEDDLILPAHGTEYILKGSELFDESNAAEFSPVVTMRSQPLKQLPEPSSSRSQDDSSSSSSMNEKTKNSQEDGLSPPALHSGSSAVSPDSRIDKNSSWTGSLSLMEYKIYRSGNLADASTQTEENVNEPKSQETCTRGVSTDDGLPERACDEAEPSRASSVKVNPLESSKNPVSSPFSASASSLGGKTDTLESLIRADASKMNSFRILEQDEIRMPTNARLKATNVLMQLISCGSISVKDNSFGLVRTYKPRFAHSKFASPFISTSFMLGELDCFSENPRLMGLKLDDKEYFSGSLVEAKLMKDVGDGTSLKRSSSFNGDRGLKQIGSPEDGQDPSSGVSKCIPHSIKSSLCKQYRSESMKSPVSEKPRSSSDESNNISCSTSNGGSKRVTEGSQRSESCEEKEKLTKIEERLTSGARVIIRSKEALDSIPSWS